MVPLVDQCCLHTMELFALNDSKHLSKNIGTYICCFKIISRTGRVTGYLVDRQRLIQLENQDCTG